MTEPLAPPAAASVPLRWWEGVASPGPGGYAVAVLVSVVAMGVLGALVESSGAAGGDPGSILLGVVLFGLVYAVFLAPPGVLVVHLVTLRVRSQWVHVLVTALVGLAAGWVVVRDPEPFVLLMGVATALGRLVVVPLVPGVRRRRLWREQRRTALQGLAARGVVDGYGAPHRRPGSTGGGPADFGPTAPPG